MSKPTLVQSLLNRPSQTYSTPSQHRKEYHSAKQEMLRIAAAQSDPSLSEYFTPNSSPRTSMAATSRKPSRRSLLDAATAVPSTRTPSGSSAQRAIYTLSTGSSLSSTSLDGHSLFSDYLTAAGSVDELIVTDSNYHDRRNNEDDLRKQAPRSKSSTTTSVTTTTTIVPASAYGMSSAKSTVTPNRSGGKGTPTKATTSSPSVKTPDVKAPSSAIPGSSKQGKPSPKEPERHSKIAHSHHPFNAFAPLTSSPVKQAPNPLARQQSTPSTPKQSRPNGIPAKSTQKPSPSTLKPSSVPNGHAHRELPPQPKPPSSQTISSYHNRRHHNTSKIQNSIMMNMSALLEEDEDGGDPSSKRPSLRHTTERGREKKRSQAPTSIASSSSSESGSVTPGPNQKHPPLHRRRSRSLDSGSSRATPRLAPQTLSAEVQALTLASHGDLPSIGTQGYTSLILPRAPMPVSDRPPGGLFGHLSFGLPNLNWNKLSLGADGKVDLTRSGIAQTTMASVEVVRGLSSKGAMFGRSGSWKVLGVLGRRPSANGRPSGPPSAVGAPSDEPTAKPKVVVEGTILGFTSYRPPPSYVPSQSVLVQVWAVGVDGVDGRLVGVRFGSATKGKSELGHEDEDGDESTEEVEDHDYVTKSTASQNSLSKNRLVALGRSLSLSLKRPKKESGEEKKSQLGRSFSLRPNKKPDPNSVSMSTPGVTPAMHTKHDPNVNATGPALPTPEKKRSGTQLQHQRSKHQEVTIQIPPAATPKLPSKPQKLKAKTKATPVPSLQVHMETQIQSHWSPVSSSVARDEQLTDLKDRHTTPALKLDQTNQPTSAPVKPRSPSKSKSKPRLPPRTPSQSPAPKPAEVGFVPGRSFVGRVLEVGWELGEEVIRKGEWVVGLVDVRKCGALAEFIVVDRHRIHRVPHPQQVVPTDNPNAAPTPLWVGDPLTSSPQSNPAALEEGDLKNRRNDGSYLGRSGQTHVNGDGNARNAKKSTRIPTQPHPIPMLTLEEMALLPLCGIPAYRAVRSFLYAFSGDGRSCTIEQHRRRALILRGHDGAGAMAVQMLIHRGWRVSVHVPFSCVPADATQELANGFMRAVEDRAREWGADEVIFDDGEAEDGDDGRAAAVRVIETLKEEGDVFDAILDTVGGKEVREAGEKLLRSNVSLPTDGSVPVSPLSTSTSPTSAQAFPFSKSKRRGIGLFTTLVGDTPERPIPSAADAFRANLRSFRFGLNDNHRSNISGTEGNTSGRTNGVNADSDIDNSRGGGLQATVGYAWVCVAHEVSEWEGADVRETLGAILTLAMEDGIRPLVEDVGGGMLGRPRVVPFEKAPGVFVDDGPLGDGGTLVVRIAG